MERKTRILLVVLACLGSIAHGRDSMSPKQAIEKLIKGIEASPGPISGRGSAHVSWEHSDEKENTVVRFQFKDALSRSDDYVVEGEKQTLTTIWGQGRECTFFYHPLDQMAAIGRRDLNTYTLTLGRDFNPSTFHRVPNQPDIVKQLKSLADIPPEKGVESQVQLDAKGLLHLHFKEQYKDTAVDLEFAFDTTKGYNLVSCRVSQIPTAKDVIFQKVASHEVDWKKWGTAWYVSRFAYDDKRIEVNRETGEPSPYHHHVEGTIDEFVPNCEIEDSAFTLASVDLPYGTLVTDTIKGEEYRVGVP